MDLYLIRHATAAWDPARWPDDRDRPLTADGEKRFSRAARGLRSLVPSVDVLLSSSFVRAWRTAEILNREAGWPKPVRAEALESGRAPAEVLQALQPHSNATAVTLVGHEPNLHELASYLLTADTGHVQLVLKKGGVVRLEVDTALRPGSALLVWLLAPKILRAIGS
jgi:phosphohistidine phosphatase